MPRIRTLFAWVSTDAGPEEEGIIGVQTPDGWIPLVGADLERMRCFRETAARTADMSGASVRLVRFDSRTQLEEIKPRVRGKN